MLQKHPIPSFFNSKNAALWGYSPNLSELLAQSMDWARQNGIKPSGSDRFRLFVLGIDLQRDFCFPEGTLYVGGRNGTGAIDDNVRIARFIYENLGIITDMGFTMDTHLPFQIFTSSFWLDENGNFVAPFTTITIDMVEKGKVRPNPAMASWLANGNYNWLCDEAKHYVRKLKEGGKFELTIWPPHCVLGQDGHALAGVIQEARMFHAYVRGAKSEPEVKGGSPLTENYSILRPEVMVRHDGKPLAQKNARFIKTLLSADAVVIFGQAASHCVKSSIDDLLFEIVATDPALAKKIYVATDGMSSVTVPNGKGGFYADYTPDAEAALQRFADAGMNLVKLADPIQSWTGIQI